MKAIETLTLSPPKEELTKVEKIICDSPHCLIWVCHDGLGKNETWDEKSLKIIGLYPSGTAAEEARSQMMLRFEKGASADIKVSDDDGEDEIDLEIRDAPMFFEEDQTNNDECYCLIWVCHFGPDSFGCWGQSHLKVQGIFSTESDAKEARDDIISAYRRGRYADIKIGDFYDDEIDLMILKAKMFLDEEVSDADEPSDAGESDHGE